MDRGDCAVVEPRLVATEPRRDAGDMVSGECKYSSGLFSDTGGEFLPAPRRTWHVGHSLTNREISSLGTLSSSQHW